jgi:hypothetical protein
MPLVDFFLFLFFFGKACHLWTSVFGRLPFGDLESSDLQGRVEIGRAHLKVCTYWYTCLYMCIGYKIFKA